MAGSTDSDVITQERLARVSEIWTNWYHLPVIAGAMIFMIWTRLQSWSNFTTDDGGFYLAGIDSYYHWRTTHYTVDNWPNTMPFEVWTGFPEGRYVGQFGTAYDQLIATIALIVGLGNPGDETIFSVVMITVPVLAALTAIPVFVIGRRLGGRIGGLGAVILLALFPGSFFSRTAAGQHQHHVAEVLLMVTAVLAIMVALSMAEKRKPVFEQVLDRDLTGLREIIGYSTLAGVVIAVYVWVWPPGVVLVGILGVYFVIFLTIEYVRGRSPDHLAFVGVISMVVAGVVVLGQIEVLRTGATSLGYMTPVLATGVALGCLFMASLARHWDKSDVERVFYPVAIAGSVGIALAIMWLLVPDVLDEALNNIQGRLTPIGASPGGLTVQEARPPPDYSAHVFQEFGLAFYTAMLGLLALLSRPFIVGRAKAEHAFLIVWVIFMVSMSTAQLRFSYYLAPAVAIMNAYAIGLVVKWADIEGMSTNVKQVEGYQLLVLATAAMILIVPLLPAVAATTVFDAEQRIGPQGDTQKWESSLAYLENGTPAVGTWGENNEPIPYNGTFAHPDDGNYAYPPGSYGVMSWWDYGHLITVEGERIPHSNPFQQHARSSAAFLLAENEERASLILDALSTGVAVEEKNTEELREIVAARSEQEQHEEIRYVMIDDAMVGGKFGAISEWTGPGYSSYTDIDRVSVGEAGEMDAPVMNEQYYNTTVARLYFGDGSGMEQYRLVHESETQSTIASIARFAGGQWQPDPRFQNQHFTGIDPMIIGQLLGEDDVYDARQGAAVKTYERVEGATITGESTAEPGSQIQASVALTVETSDRPLQYTQETTVNEDGTFSLTVPYATTEELGPADGYTESKVLADEEFTVIVIDGNEVVEEGTVAVPEPTIYAGDEVTVELAQVGGD